MCTTPRPIRPVLAVLVVLLAMSLALPSAAQAGTEGEHREPPLGPFDADGSIWSSVLLSAGSDARPEAATATAPDLGVSPPPFLEMACRPNNSCRHGVTCCSGCTLNAGWFCGYSTPSWCCACSGQWAVEASYCCSGRNTIGTGGSGWCV